MKRFLMILAAFKSLACDGSELELEDEMGRKISSGPLELDRDHMYGSLDMQGDNNIGRVVDILPNATLGLPGVETKILQFQNGIDQRSRMVTVHMDASAFIDPSAGNNIVPVGPIVGIVEFAAGGRGFSRIEFDIPLVNHSNPRQNWAAGGPVAPVRQVPNGVAISVPLAGLVVSVRNDTRMFCAGNNVDVSGANLNLAARVGAHVGYETVTMLSTKLKKTVCIVNGTALADGSGIQMGIPPYARRVRFPRTPQSTSILTVSQRSTMNVGLTFGTEVIPVGSQGLIELATPIANGLSVFNTSGGAVGITNMWAVFDLEF
jgi:hypothetical protein